MVHGRAAARLTHATLGAHSALALALLAIALAGVLGGCDQSPEQVEARLQRQCADMASEYLDPAWAPRTIVVLPQPQSSGLVSLTLSAHGHSVAVQCDEVTMMGRVLHDVFVQGRTPDPGQIYLADQGRWLTEPERLAHVRQVLALQPGEFSGAEWMPGAAGEIQGVVGGCFWMRSRLGTDRSFSTCREADRRHFWMTQHGMLLEVDGLPPGVPPLPASSPPGFSS